LLFTEITNRLKTSNIIKTPNVAVSVTAVNSKKYYLEGEVNKAGQYNLIVPTTILEALVNAGGFRDFAKLRAAILRLDSDDPTDFERRYAPLASPRNHHRAVDCV